MTIVVVIVAGAFGAPARYVLEHTVARLLGRRYPWGTLVVNVTGSFVLGIVAGTGLHGFPHDAVATGFLGAYTTFSSYAFEAVRIAQDRSRRTSAAYLAATVVLASAAAWIGLSLTG